MFCFECQSTTNLIKHHVVPRSKGGKKTLFLCQKCHDLVHGIKPRNIFISELTKTSLQKAKFRGITLGNPNIAEARKAAQIAIAAQKKAFNDTSIVAIKEIASTGIKTLTRVADCLNKRGERTSRNKLWDAKAVSRVIEASGLTLAAL